MKKKVISMLVSVIMVMSIAACGTRVNGEFTETAEALQADGNSNTETTEIPQADGNSNTEATEIPQADGNSSTETTEIPQADGNSNTEATEILQADGNSNTEAPGETKEYLVDAAFLISEQKLQEHRESYFEACGFPDNYESAYETLDRQQSPCYYRKDQQITSYSFKNGWDFSFTCDTMTKTKLQLKDILVKEEQFWAEAKTYMLEQIGQRAGHYSKVAESYQDIINSMEASTAQWDWYLDAGGLVIYFHPYILFNNYESCEFVFSYADWQEHIKGEYQVGVEPIVARISPNVPYPVTEKESLSFVYYPDSDYTITIQAGEEELTLEGFDFEAPYGYILRETPDIVYLLLETDECMDLDERIWLFKIENGVLTQCGETMHGKLIYVDSTASIVLEELVYSPSSFEEYVAVNDFDEIPLKESWCDISPYIPIKQTCCITETGNLEPVGEKSFHIIEGEDYIYGVWKRMDEAGNRVTHFEIRVCKNDRCIQKIMQDVEKFGDKLPKVEQLLLVEDRNFDGKEDILILTEPYKEGENLRYRLYQATEEGFEDTCSEVK